MVGWNFPSNGDGQERGIADAGISTFTGKEIYSLAREICQNSLDAVNDESKAVTVKFSLHKIDTADVPARDDYENILRKCRDFWPDNDKTQKFFDEAIRQLSRPKISVLRIGDFNTTGLAEPFNPLARTGWRTLTKIDGGATKTGDAAGSFGIGKNAPFTNSYLRLVFYRTLNLDGEIAAQGMSRVVSFKLDDGNISSGVGYFGEPKGNMPVTSIDALDEISPRDEVGTDVFVYGFNGQSDWIDDIFIELIENFLVAVHCNKLCVEVQGRTLDKSKLSQTIVRCVQQNPSVKFRTFAAYFDVLSETNGAVKTFDLSFHGLGTFKLRVLCGENLSNKVLIVRKSGMKLFEWSRSRLGISSFVNFAAILELDGVELNKFFRDMETPAHDKWEYKRHDDVATAKKYLRELKDWLKVTINALSSTIETDTIEVTGLDGVLNFDDGNVGISTEESLDRVKNPAETKSAEKKPRVTEVVIGKKKVSGDLKSSGNPATRKPTGGQQRKTQQTRKGEANPDGRDLVNETVAKKPLDCDKVRVINVGGRKYRLLFRIGQDIASGQIQISAVGENNNADKLSVVSAKAVKAVDSAHSSGTGIVFKNLRANANAQIDFELADERHYSLKVTVHED